MSLANGSATRGRGHSASWLRARPLAEPSLDQHNGCWRRGHGNVAVAAWPNLGRWPWSRPCRGCCQWPWPVQWSRGHGRGHGRWPRPRPWPRPRLGWLANWTRLSNQPRVADLAESGGPPWPSRPTQSPRWQRAIVLKRIQKLFKTISKQFQNNFKIFKTISQTI